MHGSNQRKNIHMQRHPRNKEKIYTFGKREEKYRVDVIDKKTGIINDIYLMKYTKEGPIFSKQTYSRWKEELAKARQNNCLNYTGKN